MYLRVLLLLSFLVLPTQGFAAGGGLQPLQGGGLQPAHGAISGTGGHETQTGSFFGSTQLAAPSKLDPGDLHTAASLSQYGPVTPPPPPQTIFYADCNGPAAPAGALITKQCTQGKPFDSCTYFLDTGTGKQRNVHHLDC